ncbi:MAG TPA: hypothetical protein DG753_05795 [Clostridium sp.]|nr:hypothetical protein [Clostridium sp.]
MNKKTIIHIRLDVGITSVGWSVINIEKQRIEDLGGRTFPGVEDPKTGLPLAAVRRNARGSRKRIRRRRYRLKRYKRLVIEAGLFTEEEYNRLSNNHIDIWKMREEALGRKLMKEEFVKVIASINENKKRCKSYILFDYLFSSK